MNALPNFSQSIADKGGSTNRAWYQFFQGIWKGLPPASESTITAPASPFIYSAAMRGFVIISGGTVTLVQFSRDGKTNYTTGQTQGCFPVSNGDSLTVTFSAAPSMTFVPQ